MFLHGNLKECSLPDLLSMLASKAETGRLDINLEESSTAQLYLMNGKPVDCALGYLRGSEALDALLTCDNGTFRFSSGVAPPNLMFRNGKNREHEVVTQDVPSTGKVVDDREVVDDRQEPDSVKEGVNPYHIEGVNPYDLTPQVAPRTFTGATLVAMLAALALGVGLTIGSVIASIQHSAKADPKVLKSESRITTTSPTPPPTSPKVQERSNPPAMSAHSVRPSNLTTVDDPETPKAKKETAKVVSIPVVVKIEDGRVVEAYVANPQPGQEAYESTALRLARQRRFNSQSGTETVFLTVSEK